VYHSDFNPDDVLVPEEKKITPRRGAHTNPRWFCRECQVELFSPANVCGRCDGDLYKEMEVGTCHFAENPLRRTLVSNQFELLGSLNGNNGSWTNSDDTEELDFIDFLLQLDAQAEASIHFEGSDQGDTDDEHSINGEINADPFDPDLENWRLLTTFADFMSHVEPNPDGSINYGSWNHHYATAIFRPNPQYSDLNGNNGEWTNTDDIETKADGNAERKRMHKEAETNRHHAGGSDKSNMNKVNAHDRVNGVERKADDKPKVIPDYKRKTVHVVDPTLPSFYVNSEQWFRDPVYQVVPPGTAFYYEKGFGWAIVPDGPPDPVKVKQDYLYPGLSQNPVDAYYAEDTRFVPCTNWLLPTLVVEHVQRRCRQSDISISTMKTIELSTRTLIRFLPEFFRDNVSKYFVALTYSTMHKMNYAFQDKSWHTWNMYNVLDMDQPDFVITSEVGSAFRRKSVDCELVVDYEVKRGVRLNGKKFERAPKIEEVFPKDVDAPKDRWYETVLCSIEGPKKFVTYENNAKNGVKALKRIISKRDNEDQLRANQKHLGQLVANERVAHNEPRFNALVDACVLEGKTDERLMEGDDARKYVAKHLRDWINNCSPSLLDAAANEMKRTAAWMYWSVWDQYLTLLNPLGSRELAADIATVKKALRKTYVNGMKVHSTDELQVERLKACVKREMAKPGKVPRLFVAYEAGCMYANELPEFVKVCMNKPTIIRNGGETFIIRVFAKPKMKEISEEFERAFAASCVPGLHYVFIYSDDSVYMGRTLAGVYYRKNFDISSCDSSNGPAIFYLTGCQMAAFDEERAIGLVKMCRLTMRLNNPNTDEVLKIDLDEPFEGSGTVVTTINNNNGSKAISIAFTYELVRLGDPTAALISAAAIVGHLGTVDDAEEAIEKVQFLKYSPIRGMDGRYYLTKNVGCLLRRFGAIDGDLKPEQVGLTPKQFRETTWQDRMRIYLSALVKSHVHEPNYGILARLRELFNVPTGVTVESTEHVELYDLSHVTLDPSSLCCRYDISLAQLENLELQISKICLGTVVVDEAAGAIYAVDYSL
jgi:hypothetical protein